MQIGRATGGDGAVQALRVLVLDPYRPGRDTLCACLEDLGHAASGARDVHDATRRLQQGPTDLILVDHSPPYIDGWQSLDVLRREGWIFAIVLVDIEAASTAKAPSLLKPLSLVALERAIAGIRRADVAA
jgi:CheY-like chemotaxis protein